MAQDVKIRISVDGREGEGAVRRLSGEFSGLQSSVQRADRAAAGATDSLARMGTAVAGLAAATVSVTSLTRAADAWSSLNAQLKIATGSAAEGATAYADVLRIATATGQSLEQVGTVYRRFAENADALNLSMAGVADISTTVAQAMALSNGTAESAQAALVQFGQALASGQLRGEEFNSIMEQAPRLAQAFADGLGVTKGALREMAQDGELTADVLVSALGRSAAKVSAEFAQLPPTIARALQNVSTAWTDTVGDFEKSTGVFSAAAGAINVVADNMGNLVAAGGAVAAVMGGRYVGAAVASTAATVEDTLAKQAALRAEVAYQQALAQTALSASARTTAITAATAAQAKLTTASSLARGALSALGGPIGIVTTALTLGATAWAVWGRDTDRATAQAATAATENLDSIIAKLTELNERLGSTSRTAYDTTIASAERELRGLQSKTATLASQLDALGQAGVHGSPKGLEIAGQIEALTSREIELQRQLAEARANAAQVGIDSLNTFAAANAVGTQKIVADQEKVLTEFAKAIERTGGVLDMSIPEHARAYDALNTKLAEIGKSGKKAGKDVKEANDAIEDLLLKLDAKEIEEAAKAVDDYNQAWSDYLDGLDKTARGLDEQIEQYGMTEAQIAAVTLRRAEDRLEMARASEGVQDDYLAALEREVELRRQIAGSAGKLEVLDANKRAADEATKEWERTANAIEDSLIDALMDGGKSGAEYIEGLFRSMVLRPVLQAVVSPVAGAITGAMGFTQPADPAPAGSSYGSLSDWSTMGTSLTGNIYQGGTYAYNAGFETLGDGMFSLADGVYSLDSTLKTVPGLEGGIGSAMGYAGALYALSNEQYGTAMGAAIGTYIMPGIGTMIGSMIGGLVDGMFGGGTPHAGAVVLSDGTTATATRSHDEVRSYYANPDDAQQFMESDFTKRYQQGVADALTPVATGLATLYNSTLSNFGLGDGYTVGLGFSADNDDASRGRFSIIDESGAEVDDFIKKFDSDPEAGMAGFIDASAAAIRDALVAADLPGWVDTLLTDLGDAPGIDALNAAIGQVDQIRGLAEALSDAVALPGEAMARAAEDLAGQFAALGVAVPTTNADLGALVAALDTTSEEGARTYLALMNLAPAFVEIQAAQTALYDQLYTDEQRAANLAQELGDAFADLAVSAPASRDAMRALIDAQDASTEAGARMKAQLLGLVPAFVEVTDAAAKAAEEAARAAEEAAAAAARAAEEAIKSATDAYNRARSEWEAGVDTARSELLTAYRSEAGELEATAERMRGFAQSLREAREEMLLGPDSPLSGQQQYAEALRAFSATSALANAGDEDALGALGGSASTYLSAALDQAGSAEDYARDVARAQAALLTAELSAGSKATVADQQLAALREQVSALIDIDDGVISVQEAIANLQLAMQEALTAQTEAMRSLIVSSVQAHETLLGRDGAIATAIATNFGALDTSLDGLLDDAELRAALVDTGLLTNDQFVELFGVLDSNHDGLISAVESVYYAIAITLASRFDSLDANFDGLIDYSEFSKAFSGMASEQTLRSVFNALDMDSSGMIRRLEAIVANTAQIAIKVGTATSGVISTTPTTSGMSLSQFTSALQTEAGKQGVPTSIVSPSFADGLFRQLDINSSGALESTESSAATITSAIQNLIDQSANTGGTGTGTGTGTSSLTAKDTELLASTSYTAATKPSSGYALDIWNMYLEHLYRKPEVGGFDYWKKQYQAGSSLGDIEKSIEYVADQYSLVDVASSKKYVSDMYIGSGGSAYGATQMLPRFFATGGAFTNGVVSRPTAFDVGVMGEAGPEAIMPLTNIGGSLGVRAQMPGQEALLAEVRALRASNESLLAEVARLRTANEATARNTHETSRTLNRVTRGGDAMLTEVSA